MLTRGTLSLVGAWCTALRPNQVPSGAAAWRAAAWPAPARWRHRARRRPCVENAKHGQLTRTAGINEVCIWLRLHQPCVALVAVGRAHFRLRFTKRAPSTYGHGRLLGIANTDGCQNPGRSSAHLQCSSRLRHLSLPPLCPCTSALNMVMTFWRRPQACLRCGHAAAAAACRRACWPWSRCRLIWRSCGATCARAPPRRRRARARRPRLSSERRPAAPPRRGAGDEACALSSVRACTALVPTALGRAGGLRMR